ncbi:hypothetical protein MTR_5g018340 [Medicago truncatula]|uniref:Uncharacterized protein n=1 Tax=Medicago truncatula TaxID=3880 RepID=G7K9E7_MEDTR|nr:hypothetical protein MTR_5g018340 [Medicago truncatula]
MRFQFQSIVSWRDTPIKCEEIPHNRDYKGKYIETKIYSLECKFLQGGGACMVQGSRGRSNNVETRLHSTPFVMPI